VVAVLREHFGYASFRPGQATVVDRVLKGESVLAVLPTGAGKSLTYQLPALLMPGATLVLSPLIALMKDQVDGLRACGVPAVQLNSSQSTVEQRAIERAVVEGSIRLLFASPERLATGGFRALLKQVGVQRFAIDEAHCISHWGHDFRPEYRRLAELKSRFPQASVHAYTATATERVRRDIAQQLGLQDPAVLVGTFDRPNLAYRIVPRIDTHRQTLEILQRHPGEAAIVYCLSRKDTESMATFLQTNNIRASHYHAGMDADDRRRAQDAFAAEAIDVVAATVAFGMGIDRSDVRCVIHAAMPKSIEHYQQETGRAGRDGLAAECVLLYSAADAMRWESLIEKSSFDAREPSEVVAASRDLLEHMRRLCTSVLCRHKQLSEYFGQSYAAANCAACDVCLNEVEGLADATVTAQKILSCVARAGERFGGEHIVDVLLGANTERVRRWGHEKLSTHGLMKGTDRKSLTNMLYQLIDAGLIERTSDERPVLRLNAASWEVLRGQRAVRLVQPKEKIQKTRFDEMSWQGVDTGLFEYLRNLRRQIASERNVPAYVVFSDATLRDMARLRPTSPAALLNVRGVGAKKLADLGQRFADEIKQYCQRYDR
jgi:ATP-dependent DNA helicase RecQ